MNMIDEQTIMLIVDEIIKNEDICYTLAEAIADIIIRVLADEGIIDRG